MNHKFDPTKASLTLRWSVAQCPEGDCGDETSLEATNITTEPESDPRHWQIGQFLAGHKIGLVPGEYALRYVFGDDGLQVLSMPVEMGEDGRRNIIDAFTPSLSEQVEKMARLLQDAPTDEQIAEGAKMIVRMALQDLLNIDGSQSENGVPSIPDLSGIKPGFVRVSATKCAYCNGHGPKLDLNSRLADLFGSLADLIQEGLPNESIVDFGRARAFIKQSGTGVDVAVGFAVESCPYALHFNELLAMEVRAQIALAESEIVREMIAATYSPVCQYIASVEGLAENFSVELPSADAQHQA